MCKATLITATHDSQYVPRFAKHPIARAGANFLNTLQDMPEFICTICHHLLFQKSVRVFDVANYNISNAIVNKCLSFRCTTQVGCSTNEFICFHCKTCLQKKTPKMPDQACANGIDLYVIPPVLHNLFPLERRVISLCIPFITVIIMRHYGGHYRMNGAPVNVPATLDHVLNVLPRMPNELQLHPMKLKRKLEYKSHYMYDVICKDTIVGALAWLKLHNVHYSCVTVNDSWSSDEGLCTAVDGNKSQKDDMVNCAWHNSTSLLHNSITCGMCQCDDNKELPVLPILSQDIVNGEDTGSIADGLGNSSDKSALNNNKSDNETNGDDERELTEDQAAIKHRVTIPCKRSFDFTGEIRM